MTHCGTNHIYRDMEAQKHDNTILKEFNGKYYINTIGNEDISDYNVNIVFNAKTNKVSGFLGCNRFFGHYKSRPQVLELGDLGLTKMYCPGEANKIENKLLKVFSKARLVYYKENGFSLYDKKKELLSAIKEDPNLNVSFEYSAISRGTYKLIKVNQKSISSTSKQKGKPKNKVCDKDEWQKLIKAFKTFEVNNMPNLKAPSEKRLFDGAAIANLKVTYNGKVYESQSFDHGNPPKEIALLVKEILSISENIE